MSLVGHLAVSVAVGTVRFTYTVENTGDDPVDVTFPSGQRYELVVTPATGGDPTWRASAGRMFTMAIERDRLAPGDGYRFEETMDDPAPGEYLAVATLAGREADAEAHARFIVG